LRFCISYKLWVHLMIHWKQRVHFQYKFWAYQTCNWGSKGLSHIVSKFISHIKTLIILISSQASHLKINLDLISFWTFLYFSLFFTPKGLTQVVDVQLCLEFIR
jgi:hypothetical protein